MTIAERVTELEENRLQAMLEADADTLDAMMADGALYIHSAGTFDTKAMFVEKVKTGALDYKEIKNDVEQISVIGTVALVTGLLNIALLREGTPAEISIRYLTVWQMDGDQPQMLSFQATPLPK